MDSDDCVVSDAKSENTEAPQENNEGTKLSEDEVFLTASELFTIRESLFKNKSKEDLELYKGHKFYYPSECADAKEIIEDIMADNNKSLNLQRIAKNKDCLKAEWNEKENVAVIPHLKGKTTQHMGITRNGKCVLSPEEALFLLEKGVIEIECNKMPLSIEEAYSVMLKGKLAVEKCEVYTHLSQQGFIVVSHQTKIGPNYLKVMNLSKRKKRKRKAENSTELPEQKRLTFSGVFTSNSKSINTENNLSNESLLNNDVSLSNDKVISSDTFLKENQDSINEIMDLELSNNVISSNVNAIDSQVNEEGISNDIISSNFSKFESHASLEKDTNIPCFKEQIKQNDPIKELEASAKDNVSLDNSNTCMADEVDETCKSIDDKVSETENIVMKIVEDNNDVTNATNNNENAIDINEIDVEDVSKENDEKGNVIDIEKACNIEIDNETADKESVKNANNGDTNEIIIEENQQKDINIADKENVKNANNGDTNEIIIEEDQQKDINIEESGSMYDDDDDDNNDYGSTDESSVVCEESDDENLDVYSCSPSDNQINNAVHNPSKIQDEEVTLVRVMKKEKIPLAVIDLLSDEDIDTVKGSEQNGKNIFEDSNEEIEILEEISVTDKNRESSQRNVNLIKLESSKMKRESSDVKMQLESAMKFPDTFKKDMICISRPPIYLLPLHCSPAKEVYIINSEVASQSRSNLERPKRLWNSYKDMQEYQRERRRERQRNSFPPRSSGPFREQNEPFSIQTPPFSSSSEYPRDFDNGRNFNYSTPTCRSFYQPMNSERGLFPTPGNFGSSNHFPFSQSLPSTDPRRFVTEIQKTVYSVASSVISTIFNQHLNQINSHPAHPTPFNNSPFMNFNPHNDNNFSHSVPPVMPSPMAYNSDRNDYNPGRFSLDPSFSGERNPVLMNESPFMMENDWRQANNFRQKKFTPRGPSFPCKYRSIRRKRNWNDIKAAVEGADLSNSGSDIEEVPINLNRFLYSNDIKPLIDPGTKLPIADGLKTLKLTQVASLCDTKRDIERYLPATLTLEISFDVYLPNTNYRRSEPSVPNYRIIIVRASDPIPRYSELVNLQRKWNDGAILQVAVVDHGDISFYSFNNVNIQELVPFDFLHG